MKYRREIDGLDFDMSKDFMTCERTFWRDGDHWSAAGAARFVGRMIDGPESALAEALGG